VTFLVLVLLYDINGGYFNLYFMQMFVFGTLALEQFVDRLIEWPQYCNHILQISHLRGTHSELVAFIEQALARISSGHSDTDGGSHASVVNHHGSSQASSGNLEVNAQVCLLTCIMHLNSPKVNS
jgi:hypothetical protein